ncbi:uncharacterized protein [Prorops nasuta]|uniref:uncharacterized protein n=1 Tax=Prorops nasuta TaxID=863751 RepID=UPI0034CE75E7
MYADDIVVMAREMKGMKMMLKVVEEFLDERGMEMNVEKTKLVRFGKRVRGKERCRWKEGWIEEEREVKYLGYVLKRNGRQEEHIAERVRKAGVVMREIWGVGRRIFRNDFARRMWLYDRMVWPVMGYGAEVWGWEERGRVEAMAERYVKWVLGVEWVTPGYMIREETKREKMRIKAARKAWDFEERLREGKGNKWIRECLKEIEKRERGGGKKEFCGGEGKDVGGKRRRGVGYGGNWKGRKEGERKKRERVG